MYDLRFTVRKATALVLVVVLVALLAIIGTTFVITSRIERYATQNQTEEFAKNQLFQAVRDYICENIQRVLEEDLWDRPEDANLSDPMTDSRYNYLVLLGAPAYWNGAVLAYVTSSAFLASTTLHNEPWDAPWTASGSETAKFYYYDGADWKEADVKVDGDPWLANIDPASGQITDLFGNSTSGWTTADANADADGDNDSDNDGVADGGGTNDSKWVKLDMKTPDGNDIWVAIRIVDTCAMVNANTAWKWPDGNDSLGRYISQIRLYDSSLGYNSPLPGRPEPLDYDNDGTSDEPDDDIRSAFEDFQKLYIFRIERPDWAGLLAANPTNPIFALFYPLDISDELELRYRWNIDKVDSGGNPIFNTVLEERFSNLQAGQSAEDNRYMLTTYSFTRHIRRAGIKNSATGWFFDSRFPRIYDLHDTIRDLIEVVVDEDPPNDPDRLKLFVKLIKESFQSDTTSSNYADGWSDASDGANYHTWQYIANLIDYLDEDDTPMVIDTSKSNLQGALGLTQVSSAVSFTGDSKVYGLERHCPITEIAVVCTKVQTLSGTPNPGDTTYIYTYKIQVELGNPWASNVNLPGRVEVHLSNSNGTIQNWTDPTNITSFTNVPGTDLSDPYAYGETNEFDISIVNNPSPSLTVSVKSFSSNDAPEDIFEVSFSSGQLPTTTGGARSYQRETDSSGGNRWKSLANKSQYTTTPSIGSHNTVSGLFPSLPAGYATSTTDTSIVDRYTHCAFDNSFANEYFQVGPTKYVKLRTYFDLNIPPYVGYCKDGTGVQKGFCDWLANNTDRTIHFDFTEDGKSKTFIQKISESFKLLDRTINGNDDNDDGTPDDIDEMRLPGLININTAPPTVLAALHRYVSGNGSAIFTGSKPYKSIADIIQHLVPGTDDFFVLGLNGTQDVVEKSAKWARFANLITTRSDTFAAYIMIGVFKSDESPESTPPAKPIALQRWVVLFDRSLCSQPPLYWNGSQWVRNLAYREPKIVAIQQIK